MKRIRIILFLAFNLVILASAFGQSKYIWTAKSLEIKKALFADSTIQFTRLLPGTPHETRMYAFQGSKPGHTVIILGGTHGNEPAGYEAAYRLISLFRAGIIQTGKVLIIPEANIQAVKTYSRRIPVAKGINSELGNLNRCYPGRVDGTPMEQLAKKIMDIARAEQVVAFIDMHESPVYHLETMKADGDGGLGQSIVFSPNEESSYMAMLVIDELNENITGDPVTFSMLERPIKNSAAWAAGRLLGNIVAFTVETCKKLPIETRIQYQVQTVKVILREKN